HPLPPLVPYTTLFRSTAVRGPLGSNSPECSADPHSLALAKCVDQLRLARKEQAIANPPASPPCELLLLEPPHQATEYLSTDERKDRKSTRLNSSHRTI